MDNISNEMERENVMSDCDYRTDKISWNEAMTKLFIEEVGTRIHLFGVVPFKTLWKSVATAINMKGYNLNAEHCNSKWKSLKKKYKAIKDNNKRSGAGAQCWIYFDAIDDILKQHPEITPLSVASSTSGFRINEYSDEDESNENTVNDGSQEIPSCDNNLKSYRPSDKCRKTRKANEPYWATQLRLQREKHHKENLEQKERFLALLEQRNLNI